MVEINTESKGLVIGIDASNLRQGGGVTHLVELLSVVEPSLHGIERVVIWGASKTLIQLREHPWLEKVMLPRGVDLGLIQRTFWQHFKLSQAAVTVGCDLLFIPGGTYLGSFRPVVTMSRNMLPFELRELHRYR